MLNTTNEPQANDEQVADAPGCSALLDQIIPQGEFLKRYSDRFSRSQLHWLLRQRERNGLLKFKAVKKCGKRIYIHVPNFAAWLDSQSA
jgi:hypothetical protein